MTPLSLSQLGKIVTGKTPKTSREDFFGGNTPFVTPSDMDERRLISETARTLTEDGVASVKSSVIPAGSVMVSCIGSDMGKTYLSGKRSVTNQQINTLIVDDKRFSPLFIYYNLFGRRTELREKAAGAAQPILNKTEFGKVVVDVPTFKEQREIAAVLGALDDKIELNRKTAATLEAMARALYRSWFVDFDPVHAKAEGRAPAHMPPQTAALFPDNFGEDGLPEGWMNVRVDEICSRIFSGGTPKTSEASYWNGQFPWLSSGETRKSFIVDTEKTITDAGIQGSSTRLARSGAVVVASAGQGKTRGQTSYLSIDSYVNQSVIACEADKSVVSDSFLFCDLKRRYEEFRAISDANSSRGSLTTKLIGGLDAVLPPRDIVQQFDTITAPMISGVLSAAGQSQTLATLRDTLLPRLMSGELRVGEAKEQVEGVV